MKTDDQESRANDGDVSLWIWAASIAIVIFLWATITFLIDVGAGEQKFDRGTFGDMFGAVNALFSGLALATLFYTVFLQRRELKETRKELSDQRDQMEIQADIFRKQAFEDTFFRLLERQRKLADDAVVMVENPSQNPLLNKEIRGRDCFRSFMRSFKEEYLFHSGIPDIPNPDMHGIESAYLLGMKSAHGVFVQQYFSALCRFLIFLEGSGCHDFSFYRGLVRDQLSSDELVALFYVCIGRGANSSEAKLFIAGEVFLDLDPSFLIKRSHANYIYRRSTEE